MTSEEDSMAMLRAQLDQATARTVMDVGTRTRRWIVTAVAAGISFVALDVLATAGGITLAASGLLGDRDVWVVYTILAFSYVVWGVGMHANLRANGDLLTATGTSTNALSKFLFDWMVARTDDQRIRRGAASLGYAGTEIILEVPYYASAFGAALASEMIDSTDALVFLAGTNLAAAGYEYIVSRLTRGYLGSRRRAHQVV
jgi:hypothetical protein